MKALLLLAAAVFASSASAQSLAPVAPAQQVPSLAAPAVPAEPTTVPSDGNYRDKFAYQSQWEDYLLLKKGKPFDIVFIGDSITEQWRWGAGRPVWKELFEGRAFDFGRGGDRTQHVLWRLENLDVRWLEPKVAVIMIGTNNVSDTPEDIAAGVRAVVEKTKRTFPGAKIVVVSILPRSRATETMAAVNPLLEKLADGESVYYLDLAAKFTPQGDNWKGLLPDKLHLTTDGYRLWAAELEPLLQKLVPRK